MIVVTPKEMAALDRRTIQTGTPALELMERAGSACTEVIEEHIKKDDSVLILCGTGNNGGDGEVIARLLAEAGYHPEVFITAAREQALEKFSPESRANYDRLGDIPVYFTDSAEDAEGLIAGRDVIIDAVFGTGLDDRPLPESYAQLFETVNASGATVIAIDIPSGLSGETGQASMAVAADLTIPVQYIKTGELLEDGPDATGELVPVDIGITAEGLSTQRRLLTRLDINWPLPRKKNSHKYHYGTVAMVAGSKGMIGAAALASRAALRCGSGLVTNFVPEEIYQSATAMMPPEALVRPYQGIFTLQDLDETRHDVVLFGPGIGRHMDYSGLILDLLAGSVPLVIDADGLWMLKRHLDEFRQAQCPVILTPHQGEFSQLLSIELSALKKNPLGYAEDFAAKYQVTLVLKGNHTIIAAPDGRTWFNTTGNPGMATPGSGDVLAGMAAAIFAQTKDPIEAAKAAVYYHGLSGDWYAEHYGQTTLLAGDIINSLRQVLV